MYKDYWLCGAEPLDVCHVTARAYADPSSPPVVRNVLLEPVEIAFGWHGTWNPLSPFTDEGGAVYGGDAMILDLPMKILVYGRRGISLPDLVGRENRDRFESATSHLYGLALTQLMDGARIPTDASSSSSMQGTVTTPSGYRLKQSAISTHILSCLLAMFLVVVVVSTLSVSMRRVLLKNTCSIAAVASLLFDSDLPAIIKADFQRLSERELANQFEGYTFSMGWWTGGEGDIGRRRFGIDFGGAAHLR